jgi:MoxR-like ATPase
MGTRRFPVVTAIDDELVAWMGECAQQIREGVGRRIVGMPGVVEELLITLFSGGHALLVGVPGLAKTLMVATLSELLGLDFRRIQFTPDLMPSDITGTEVIVEDRSNDGSRSFRFMKGPIFANMILADEINRTPPKTQAAMLEAMEEGQVTSLGRRYQLAPPFFVMATQNPIEQEGTYPLPVTQLDRFMFEIRYDYPSRDEEYQIVRQTLSRDPEPLEPILTADDILKAIAAVRAVTMSEELLRYSSRLVRASRPGSEESPEFIEEWVAWGAGPRAVQYTILGAKTRALLDGRREAKVEDIRAVLIPVLRHRIQVSYHAEVDGVTSDTITSRLLEEVRSPDRRRLRVS